MTDREEVKTFSHLTDQYGVLLKGRQQLYDPTPAQLRQLQQQVDALRDELGIPLVLVSSQAWADAERDENKPLYGAAFVGLPLLVVPVGAPPVAVNAAHIDVADVPAVVWERLGESTATDDTHDGIWVSPSCWSTACLVAGEVVVDEDDDEDDDWDDEDLEDEEWDGDVEGDELAIGSSAAMDEPYAEVDEEGIARIRSGEPVWFWATYC